MGWLLNFMGYYWSYWNSVFIRFIFPDCGKYYIPIDARFDWAEMTYYERLQELHRLKKHRKQMARHYETQETH